MVSVVFSCQEGAGLSSDQLHLNCVVISEQDIAEEISASWAEAKGYLIPDPVVFTKGWLFQWRVAFRWVLGWVVWLWERRGKGEGGGEGGRWGADGQRNRQVSAHAFVKSSTTL